MSRIVYSCLIPNHGSSAATFVETSAQALRLMLSTESRHTSKLHTCASGAIINYRFYGWFRRNFDLRNENVIALAKWNFLDGDVVQVDIVVLSKSLVL